MQTEVVRGGRGCGAVRFRVADAFLYALNVTARAAEAGGDACSSDGRLRGRWLVAEQVTDSLEDLVGTAEVHRDVTCVDEPGLAARNRFGKRRVEPSLAFDFLANGPVRAADAGRRAPRADRPTLPRPPGVSRRASPRAQRVRLQLGNPRAGTDRRSIVAYGDTRLRRGHR